MLKLRSAGHEDCRNRLLNRLGNVTRLRFHSLTLTFAMAVLSQSGCALFQRNSTGAASAKPSLFGPRPINTSAGQPTAQRGPVRLMPPEATNSSRADSMEHVHINASMIQPSERCRHKFLRVALHRSMKCPARARSSMTLRKL